MERCFVIQPFDRGAYDKRYRDTFEPAIKRAGLEPYRVDRDPASQIPIDDIESGIRNAAICFAEISTPNPNVWFELGYAIAAGKPVVMVREEGARLPFDVRHRTVVDYQTDAESDFKALGDAITERLMAALRTRDELATISDVPSLTETKGLSQHETAALIVVAQSTGHPNDAISLYALKDEMRNAGTPTSLSRWASADSNARLWWSPFGTAITTETSSQPIELPTRG